MRKLSSAELVNAHNVFERHHAIPISTSGWDVEANIMLVSRLDHVNHIHAILDIPSKVLRKFRAEHSFYFFTDPRKALEAQIKVQRLYFAKFPELSERIQELHIISMKKLVVFTGEHFRIDVGNVWTSNDFQELLRLHHKQLWYIFNHLKPP